MEHLKYYRSPGGWVEFWVGFFVFTFVSIFFGKIYYQAEQSKAAEAEYKIKQNDKSDK